MAVMALMTIIHMMVLISMSCTILHIINDVMDMVIMAAISITALMATLAVMDLRV